MAPRVLIFTASIGAGHDLPAQVLAAAVNERGSSAEIVDGLEVGGPVARAVVASGSSLETTTGNLGFEAAYFLGTRFAPMRRAGSGVIDLVMRRRTTAFLARKPADVIVSTYPITTAVLGGMRANGSLGTPVVSAITDLAALNYWAHPGVDLHLLTHPESEPEVRSIAGPRTRVETVHGLTDPRFLQPPDRDAARAELGVPLGRPLVVVSGGGWGVGDLRGASDAALQSGAAKLVVLAGNNEKAKAQLELAYESEGGRVEIWGFTDRMPTLLAGANVLVHSTAGLTVLEALMCGCRVISYGWHRGHIRVNNEAYERLGMATVAKGRPALSKALRHAIAAGPLPPNVPDLPAAADLVLALAGAGEDDRRRSKHRA
jgi:UDP-N-acetylglucosamine:LPS N-acetylglucosamine transferase